MDESDDGHGNHDDDAIEPLQRKRCHPDSSNLRGSSSPVTSLDILARAENPNFEELARQYPAFAGAWAATKANQREKGPHATFSSCVTQELTIALTRALLQALFQLKLPYLDEGHLCPPVPNRFFYLHWIHTCLLPRYQDEQQQRHVQRCGLDIGSGASCIYPLLAARFFRCTMVTSEIDPKAVRLARANVAANHLTNVVTVLQVSPSCSQQQQQQQSSSSFSTSQAIPGGPLKRALDAWKNSMGGQHQNGVVSPPLSSSPATLDFVMTNPPFYDNSTDVELMEHSNARTGDGRARTSMTVSEGTYPGGEAGFVLDLLEDSLMASSLYTPPSVWYSSMLGKKSSLVKLQKLLTHILGPALVEATEYGPGQYTRWFLAWKLQQPSGTALGALLPSHREHDCFLVEIDELSVPTPQAALQEVTKRVIGFCESSPGGWDLSTSILKGTDGPFDGKEDTLNITGNSSDAIGNATSTTVRIQETMPAAVNQYVDESQPEVQQHIPQSILRSLQRRCEHSHVSFLPEEGHFVIDVNIQAKPQLQAAHAYKVEVHLSCYRHSARGAKAIEKIRNSLAGEVCQTNRKWRKIRLRQHDNQQMG